MRKNKNRKGLVAALACTMLVTAIGGFAWLTASDVAESTQTITAGEFSIEFTDESNAISKLIDLPKTQADARLETPALFTVHNDGTIAQSVKLQAEAVGVAGDDVYGEVGVDDNAVPAEQRMALDSSLINVEIYEAEDVIGTDEPYYAGTLAALAGDGTSKGITNKFDLAADGSKAFKMIAWIDEDAVNTDLYGANEDKIGSITFKVGAYGVQRDGGLGATDANWDANIKGLFN